VGENLDEGLGFEVRAESDDGGDRRVWVGLVGDKEVHGAHLSAVQRRCSVPLRARPVSGLGWLWRLGRNGALGLFLFFCSTYFSFFIFETRGFVFATKFA
jgi:hypothetical protein